MKIGVVHFGSFPYGATKIVTSLIEGITKHSYHLYGIEYNRETNAIDVKELHKDRIEQASDNGEALLKSFPREKWGDHETLSQFDAMIVLGGKEQQVELTNVQTLFVPFSIYNELDDSQFSLGYDTALNSIVEDIEKIRDTASSLSYHKVRVFNVQLPGKTTSKLLLNTAVAVDGDVVTSQDEEGTNRIKNVIHEKERNGEGYCFILMDSTVDPTVFEQPIKSEFDIDWKVAIFDEFQCVGPFPTALDKVLTKKAINEIFNWIEANSEDTGKLVIQNNEVLFQPLKIKTC